MGSVKAPLFLEGIILSLVLPRLLHQDSKLLALCWSQCTTCIALVAFYHLKRGNVDVASCTQSLTRRMREQQLKLELQQVRCGYCVATEVQEPVAKL